MIKQDDTDRIASKLATVVADMEGNGRHCGTQWLAARLADALTGEAGFRRSEFMLACGLTAEGWHK